MKEIICSYWPKFLANPEEKPSGTNAPYQEFCVNKFSLFESRNAPDG
jgi:hypothetical protein